MVRIYTVKWAATVSEVQRLLGSQLDTWEFRTWYCLCSSFDCIYQSRIKDSLGNSAGHRERMLSCLILTTIENKTSKYPGLYVKLSYINWLSYMNSYKATPCNNATRTTSWLKLFMFAC